MKKVSIEQVRDYCVAAHESIGQKYGDKPYSFHLGQVVEKTARFLHLLDNNEQRDLAIKGAWAHDLSEDVKAYSYNDNVKAIGKDVAEISFLLETPKGRNRDERHCDAYYQGMSVDVVAVMVKVADRMANLGASIHSFQANPKRGSLLHRYVSERSHFEKFMRSAWPQLEPMWERLDALYLEANRDLREWEQKTPVHEKATA
jgi:(p)ppGpp synthase/HD superfamily hydrolase